mmetsp:Transcript_5205/g.12249  ORF Transcript_5205/g.12249 Transcript_5205/m.12249 type:complete len:325 (-) Transcript_5205:2220-3194(-)
MALQILSSGVRPADEGGRVLPPHIVFLHPQRLPLAPPRRHLHLPRVRLAHRKPKRPARLVGHERLTEPLHRLAIHPVVGVVLHPGMARVQHEGHDGRDDRLDEDGQPDTHGVDAGPVAADDCAVVVLGRPDLLDGLPEVVAQGAGVADGLHVEVGEDALAQLGRRRHRQGQRQLAKSLELVGTIISIVQFLDDDRLQPSDLIPGLAVGRVRHGHLLAHTQRQRHRRRRGQPGADRRGQRVKVPRLGPQQLMFAELGVEREQVGRQGLAERGEMGRAAEGQLGDARFLEVSSSKTGEEGGVVGVVRLVGRLSGAGMKNNLTAVGI